MRLNYSYSFFSGTNTSDAKLRHDKPEPNPLGIEQFMPKFQPDKTIIFEKTPIKLH